MASGVLGVAAGVAGGGLDEINGEGLEDAVGLGALERRGGDVVKMETLERGLRRVLLGAGVSSIARDSLTAGAGAGPKWSSPEAGCGGSTRAHAHPNATAARNASP